MTGHALGCAFEDVTMMNSLAFGVMPALQHDIVANVDPVLDMKVRMVIYRSIKIPIQMR